MVWGIAYSLLFFISALKRNANGMYVPSFTSEWVKLKVHSSTLARATISHTLGEYPVKVDVQVKVRSGGNDYIFTGLGSAHRDDYENAPYGGTIYIYNDNVVKLFVPFSRHNDPVGLAAFTGRPHFEGSGKIRDQYTEVQARVRAWKLSDIGNPSFTMQQIPMDDRNKVYVEVKHNLGVYPDIVSVQVIMADGFISDAQGNAFATAKTSQMSTGGLVFGYDQTKIRLWSLQQLGTDRQNGGVFSMHNGWLENLSAEKCTIKIMMWNLPHDLHIFTHTVNPFGIGITPNSYEVSFQKPYSLDDHLVTVKIILKDGNNTNYRFNGAGSCFGGGAAALGSFGGVVYVYSTDKVLLYRPSDNSLGKLVYIGDRWGNGNNRQSSNVGTVIVEVFKLQERPCQIPPEVSNATKYYDNLTEGGIVVYSCNAGFYLSSGRNTLTCVLSSWQGDVPVCSEFHCAIPGEIGHASMVYTGINEGDTVEYTCKEGYVITHGNRSRTCGMEGQWSGIPPICTIVECPSPPTIYKASRCVTGIEAGDSVYNYCYYGYRKTSGDVHRTCQPDGSWSGTALVCKVIECPDPGQVANAVRELHGTIPGNKVFYTCSQGYTKQSGDSSRTCQLTGWWYGTNPVCVAIPCQDPGDVTNATKSLLGLNVGDKVTYTCSFGYNHTQGDLTRTCKLGGVWDGTPPVCIESTAVMCSDPGQVTNAGKQLIGTSPGSSVIYTCNSGYQATSGNLVRTCQNSGSWSGIQPVCSIIQCHNPGHVPNAVHIIQTPLSAVNNPGTGSGNNPGDIANYSCHTGFFHSFGDLQRTCQASGTWSGTPPVCSPIQCPDPGVVHNANRSMDGNGVGDNVTFVCLTGYTCASGQLVLTCNASGDWEGRYPVCNSVQCGDPGGVTNAIKSLTGTSYGQTVVYTCDASYVKTAGDLMRTCTAHGTWNGTTPVCSDNLCPLPSLPNGSYILRAGNSVGDSMVYRCHDGYILTAGSTNITCLPSRVWDSQGPVCTLVTCGEPGVGANTSIAIERKTYGGSANYTCDPGFAITSGDSIRYCISTGVLTGQWTGSIPVCTEFIPVVPSLNNLDMQTLRRMVALLRSNLKVPVKNTTLYKRTLISVPDNRPSSGYVGVVGVTMLTLAVGSIVFIDVFNFLRFRNLTT